jgi:hypothetical protein
LLTINPNGFRILVKDIYTADHRGSIRFRKVGDHAFVNRYYDQLKGSLDVIYRWKDGAFSKDAPIGANENITFTFQSVNNEQKIKEVSQIEDKEIVKEQEVLAGKIIIFSKRDDNEHIFGAYRTKDTLYELGIVGGLSSQMDDELLSIKELKLFNKSLIRIKGVFGANAPVQNYFSMEDGKIVPFLRVETGHATEVDLDGDGTVEIVSSHGTPIQTYIYKRSDGKFTVVNVNEALGATSVYLNDEKKFEAFFNKTDTNNLFEYNSGGLNLFK